MPLYRRKPVPPPPDIIAERWYPGKKIEGVVEEDRPCGGGYAHAWIERSGFPAPEPVYEGDYVYRTGLGTYVAENPTVFERDYELVPEVEPIDLEATDQIAKAETVTLIKRSGK